MAPLKRIVNGALFSLIVCAAGCASAPPTTLAEMRVDQARKLAVRCFWEHQGERAIIGPSAVFSACHQWANKVVRIRYGSAAQTAAAFKSGI